MADVEQLAGILPLLEIAGASTQGHRQDLAVDVGTRVGGGQAIAPEQLHVRPDLELTMHLGLQVAVAERGQEQNPTVADREALVLGVEPRRAARRPIGGAQLQVADLGDRPPGFLRRPPCQRGAAERRPAVVDAEQRRAVSADQRVERVAVFVIEVEAGKLTELPDTLK